MNRVEHQSGFSVVELMVALSVTMLVILGVLQVFQASFRANNEAIAYTTVNENLRAVASAMGRDIRRAGFWSGAVLEVKSGAQNNPFTNTVRSFDQNADGDDDCIIYGYDRDEDGLTDDVFEWRGFRFSDPDADGVGVIETKTGGAMHDDQCADGAWTEFIDPDVVQVTDLRFDYSGDSNWVKVTDDCPDTATESRIYVRTVLVRLSGRLAADHDVQRSVQTLLRLRNDRVDTTVATVCT